MLQAQLGAEATRAALGRQCPGPADLERGQGGAQGPLVSSDVGPRQTRKRGPHLGQQPLLSSPASHTSLGTETPTQSNQPLSSCFISCHKPWPPLLRFWVRPLPGREVAPQVLAAERREVGAKPPADPPLALGRVPAPRAAELVPVVLSSDPPARRGQRAASAPGRPWAQSWAVPGQKQPEAQPVMAGSGAREQKGQASGPAD